MSVLAQIFPKIPLRQRKEGSTAEKGFAKTKSLNEIFWFATSLTLFVLMGPFSAIAALAGVFSLAFGQEKGREPKSAV